MMKHYPWPNRSVRSLVLLVIACFSVETLAQQTEVSVKPELKIAVGRNTPSGKEKYSGYLNPMLRELFSRSGIDYQFITTPVSRGLDEANSGNVDGAIFAARNLDSRFSDLVSLPQPIVPVEFAGLYTRDDMAISSADDFFKYRLAYIRGFRHTERLFGKHDRTEEVRNPNVLMNMLMHDRVDVVFYATFPGKYIANDIGMDNLKVSDFYIEVQLYLHLNKRHAGLLPVLKTQLAAMKADGTFDSILADHGVVRSR